MRGAAAAVRQGVAAAIALLLLSGCDLSASNLPLPGGADVGDDSYAVTIEFRDVLDLVPQSAVKVDDVTVGKVEDISLDGWTAVVKVRLNGKVRLPENSQATIRQTSLLGEKFVSLSPPSAEPATGVLGNDDIIPLSRSGRNPEVEEVLGALSLVLNGGGVAQLKTISRELGNVLGGHESDVRSVVHRLDEFMGQLDDNKGAIVDAIESLNELSKTAKQQEQSIIDTVDDLPAALELLDEQRSGLVKMLRGLQRLSPIAVRVIKSSKRATLADLEALDPILTKLAEAGDAVPKSFQLLLTYPFVDAAVGTDPEDARIFRQGDYTNLAVTLDLDLGKVPTVGLPRVPSLPDVPAAPSLPTLPSLPSLPSAPALPNLPALTSQLPQLPRLPGLTVLPGPTIRIPGLPAITLPGGLALPQSDRRRSRQSERLAASGYDEDLALLLLQGVVR
jgi:phospholipid/cholesterol/gamma-HCH transport system substrate-binding protein